MLVRSRASGITAIPRRARTAIGSRTLIAVAASVAMIATGAGTAAAQTAGPASGSGRTSNVIVMLRNQHTDLALTKGKKSSARINAYRSDQSPLISRAKSDGAKNLHGFDTVNAVAATVTQAQAAQLAADPSVAAVYPDLPLTAAPVAAHDRPGSSGAGAPTAGTQNGSICPSDPSKPLLEPEALQITNDAFSDPSVPQAQQIVDGTGVKVAFIADGVDTNNPDFVRANGDKVFVDYQDFSGEGLDAPSDAAEAFGDASAIAAQGRQVYDLATEASTIYSPPTGCTIQIRGMAPGASLIGLKVFGNANTAPTSRFIEAIDYAVTDGADVLNESFGGNPYPDNGNDPISLADASAIAAGVTVVASSGDAGVNGTVGSPASANIGIIGVGATTMFRSYLQEGYAGASLSNGTWVDNNISGLSSGGITQAGRTPDLVAPGDLGWALCTPTALYEGCASDIQDFGGTSQSSPLTAGAAALVIAAFEQTHNGAKPTPAVVKQILTGTATDLGHPAYEQGAGELNALKAVQAAQNWVGGSQPATPGGSALVVDKTQLTSAAYPYSLVSQGLTVTNVGSTPQRVTATTRTLGRTVSDTRGTVALNTATAPTYVDSFGIPRSYAKVTFTVGRAVDRLTMYEAAASGSAASRIILIDPQGAYAAYSIPQGAANYAMSDVRYPAAGTWTAYIALSKGSGFNGTVTWRVLQQDFTSDGIVLPSSFTLAPGASQRLTVISREPASPGDVSASVQLNGSVSGVTSVPFSLRAVVPPTNYSFTGTILGGNGRGAVGQAQVYYLDVPRGQRNLGVGISLADPGDLVMATLTAPTGQSYSYNSNVSPDGTALEPGIQDYVDHPMAGRWVLSVQVADPVSGSFTSSPYLVRVRYNAVTASARALPTSTRTVLPAGKAVTIPVTITNSSAKPLQYSVDPRLDQVGTLTLGELNGHDSFALPQPAGLQPIWLVPTHVSSLTLAATADQGVNVDFFWQGGDPDVYAGAAPGSTATSVTMTGNPVAQGLWSTDIGQTGPFSGPAPAGTVSTAVTATGQLFDTTVTSSTGDFQSVGVTGQSSAAPATLAGIVQRMRASGGASGGSGTSGLTGFRTGSGGSTVQQTTVMVTITPTGPAGTQVRGHLYIGAVDGYTFNGDELVDLPYAYTVG
jgi:subtilisin family serine protease